MHSLKQKIAEFYALPKKIGTQYCDWCGEEIDDSNKKWIVYWAYNDFFIVPERAQLCSKECLVRLGDRISDGEFRLSSPF